MKVFSATLATETNTFAPLPTGLDAFRDRGYFPAGTHPDAPQLFTGPLWAARLRAAQHGLVLAEGLCASAMPAGPTTRLAHETLRDALLADLRAAMPVDIVLLGLHGAMVADGYEDVEGDLLARVRAIVGPKAVVGAEYDLHCHLTEKRVAACDLVVLFKEFPHTDFLARAEELVDLAVRTHRGEVRPVMRTFDCRTLQGAFMTNQPLGRAFVDRIMAMEGKDGVLSISVAHGFSAGDVPEVGTRTLVITDGDPDKASRLAEDKATT
jgi:microcystin degradation protein MlrC